MKRFEWDEEKNKKLKEERNISFEEIKAAIESGYLIDTFDHPNQKQYPGQKIMAVSIENYIYLIPYIEDKEKYFLKTIFPSRKATKKYLKEKI